MAKRLSNEARRRQEEFSRLAARAAKEAGGPEPTEEEIVQALKSTREALYRELYDTCGSPWMRRGNEENHGHTGTDQR